LLVLWAAILFFGCAKKQADVAIKVNGKSISKADIANATEMIKQSILSTFPEKSLEGLPENLEKEAVQQLIANELMLEEAKNRNISIAPSTVDQIFNQFKSRFADTALFNRQLLESGQTESGIRAEMEKGAMLDSLLKEVLQGIDSTSEQECKDFYNENSSKFTGAPRIRVSQIFFKADTSDKQKMENVRKKATGVLSQIKSGKNFGTLAAKHDEGPGKSSKGDIGWFKKGDLKPELETPLQSLKVGDVTDLISTDVGFHILMKTDEESSHILPFDEVKDNIHMMIGLKKRSDYLKQFVDSLQSRASIVYLDTSLISHE